MESKNLKDVYNRLIDLYGFYEINKDFREIIFFILSLFTGCYYSSSFTTSRKAEGM